MAPRAYIRLFASASAALALAGCGESRTRPPDVSTPAVASGERDVSLPESGIRFTAPGSWINLDPQDTRVGGIQSGTATLAVWRYVRTEPLPAGKAELTAARKRLVAQVQERAPGVKIDKQEDTRVAGAPAVTLLTTQTVAGSVRRYRSVHVFKDGAEVVLDGSAPPDQFARVDQTVYQPLVRSLRLRAPASS